MFEPVRMVGLWIQKHVHVHAQDISLGLVAKVSTLKTSRGRESKILITSLTPPATHIYTHQQ